MEKTPKSPSENKKGERIAKVMARAGLCSRRDAEKWIADGRVQVNGDYLTSPACLVTAEDDIVVDGRPLPKKEKTRLFLYHKPAGLVTTHKDEKGRQNIFESLPKEFLQDVPRVISVGRLDINTEGLLLLTNDGELSRYLELPENGIVRGYRVRAYGHVNQEKLDKLKKGVRWNGIRYRVEDAKLDKQQGDNAWIEIYLKEGKNREVRNIMEAMGLKVNRLIRLSYGPFQLGSLPKSGVMEVKTQDLKKKISGFFKS